MEPSYGDKIRNLSKKIKKKPPYKDKIKNVLMKMKKNILMKTRSGISLWR